MSSFARILLDDSWLDDLDLDHSNADTNCDAEPDDDNMPLPPEDFYTT
jgi:hypothetical protein